MHTQHQKVEYCSDPKGSQHHGISCLSFPLPSFSIAFALPSTNCNEIEFHCEEPRLASGRNGAARRR